jgi:hypothetical protein
MILVLGAFIVTMFLVLFYLEDREGGGLYDPDPTAHYRYRNRK